MRALEGIGRTDRKRIAAILRSSGHQSLKDSCGSGDAAKMLSRWTKKGWMSRMRGLYVPVPLESPALDMPLEDPWLVGVRLYYAISAAGVQQSIWISPSRFFPPS